MDKFDFKLEVLPWCAGTVPGVVAGIDGAVYWLLYTFFLLSGRIPCSIRGILK